MTFFQRIRTPFTDNTAEEQARLQPRVRLVGELLQERREDLGFDLDEIGAMLRIKPAYLAALEQGRAHDLPGPTYAIGFIRAYAEFLGLDVEQVLARFKAEAAGVTARPDLALPVPLGERSMPGGALVLVALIVALCGYGIWYYLSTEERNRPERVAAVPASLQVPSTAPTLVPPPSDAPAPGPDSNAAQPAPTLFGAAANSPQAPAAPAPSPAAPTAPQPATPQIPPAPPPLSPGALITSMPRTGPAGQPAAAPAAVVQATPLPPPVFAPPASPTQPQAIPTAPAVPAPPPPPPATQATQAMSAAPPAVAPSPTPGTPASSPSPGHVTIRALADCWIQVRAGEQIVFARVLKSGEVYNVPARAGLSLRTGNAGALEVAVDGKTVPSIGGLGALRRDVVLDPAELAAGTAVHG